MTTSTATLDQLFKEAASLFASGVTVVSAQTADAAHGVTVSAFSSLSLEPSMVLVCLAHNSRVLPLIRESGTFAVSVLAEDQQELATALSKSTRAVGEGMDGITTPGSATGAPVIRGCLAYFECSLREEIVGGDHAILLGHVEEASRGSGSTPLVFFNRQFRRLE
jgi:flavin reductase (DIM6/NTAB) family NADH-FMN oxidoreductase RutF